MKRLIVGLVSVFVLCTVLTVPTTVGATTAPPTKTTALHNKVIHETAAQLVANAPYGASVPIKVTSTHPKTDFSVTLGWVWYIHFNHDDVQSFDWYQAVGGLSTALTFACGLVAGANLIAGAVCGVLAITAGVVISLLMHGAQNKSAPVAAFWLPMVKGPLGWQFPTVWEKWYGLTLKMTYAGSPDGYTYDFPSCPC